MAAIDVAAAEEPRLPVAAKTLEAARRAWALCRPHGYLLDERAVSPASCRAIAALVPGYADSPRTQEMVTDFFPPAGEEKVPIFLRMLKARRGRVHFLHFWRAFGEAARLLEALQGGGDSCPTERLAEEVEVLRDATIRALDADRPRFSFQDQRLSEAAVAALLRNATEMSIAPAFWRAMVQGLPGGDLSSDDLTAALVAWVAAAAAWRRPVGPPSPPPKRPLSPGGMPVLVHIYDVSHEDSVHKLNKWLAHKRNPLKFGGVFHAGIEVNGLEWSFGMSLDDTVPGVACALPRQHPEHRYRQTVKLGSTKLSPEEVAEMLSLLLEEYPGDDYDLLRRNCCHFADDFARRLGVGHLPGWVHRLARVGAAVDDTLYRVAKRRLIAEDTELL